MRAGGSVRYVRISTTVQLLAAAMVAVLLLIWIGGIGAMLWRESAVARAAHAVARDRAMASDAAARARADKRSVNDVARTLEQRQDALDALMHSHFGSDADARGVIGASTGAKTGPAPGPLSDAAADSGTSRLAKLAERQAAFARALDAAARVRLARVEAAIRGVGLNPAQLSTGAQGGPFVPVPQAALYGQDPKLRALAGLLDRLSALESAFTVLPSGRPTMAPMQSSSYGYRRDPFNGMPAFHAGIDFTGAYGQPILAASSGKVVYAGPRAGYGNCLEIDHGHAIVTRYAHLSGFSVKIGQAVTRGQQVARMGSTGRSTGTHLHFEVRVRGQAVDPRPFLEARHDVLEVRQVIKQPVQQPGDRG